MTFDAGSALFVGMGTLTLSMGQAWALETGPPRAARYAVVWALAVLMMAGIAYRIFDLAHAPANARHGATVMLVVLSGTIAALALFAGARWGKRAVGSPSLVGAAGALAAIHVAVVFFGGVLGFAIFFMWSLSRVQW